MGTKIDGTPKDAISNNIDPALEIIMVAAPAAILIINGFKKGIDTYRSLRGLFKRTTSARPLTILNNPRKLRYVSMPLRGLFKRTTSARPLTILKFFTPV